MNVLSKFCLGQTRYRHPLRSTAIPQIRAGIVAANISAHPLTRTKLTGRHPEKTHSTSFLHSAAPGRHADGLPPPRSDDRPAPDRRHRAWPGEWTLSAIGQQFARPFARTKPASRVLGLVQPGHRSKANCHARVAHMRAKAANAADPLPIAVILPAEVPREVLFHLHCETNPRRMVRHRQAGHEVRTL